MSRTGNNLVDWLLAQDLPTEDWLDLVADNIDKLTKGDIFTLLEYRLEVKEDEFLGQGRTNGHSQ